MENVILGRTQACFNSRPGTLPSAELHYYMDDVDYARSCPDGEEFGRVD